MKKAGIRETQVNLSELLRKLPFVITRYGKEVAVVMSPKDAGVFNEERFDEAVEIANTRELKDDIPNRYAIGANRSKHIKRTKKPEDFYLMITNEKNNLVFGIYKNGDIYYTDEGALFVVSDEKSLAIALGKALVEFTEMNKDLKYEPKNNKTT